MVDSTQRQPTARESTHSNRYYKIQMRAWTSFDGSRMELNEIAERIQAGSGFLTAIEVVKVAEDLSAIDDVEVRQSFENIIAAERVLQNLTELPKSLREKLYTALSREAEGIKRTLAA